MDVFDLAAKLTLDSSEYDKGLSDAEGKAGGWGSKVTGGLKKAGVAAGATFTAIVAGTTMVAKGVSDATANVAEYGDNIDKMSQKMGISAQAYQEWDAVMQHSGTSIDSLKASMKTMATAAENGNEAFTKLGISEEEVANLSQEDLFSKVITGLQEMGESTERTYLAGQLLGRGATELGALLNTSAEETQAMKDRVHELGGVMSDEAVKSAAAYQDTLQDMQTGFQSLQRNLVSEFLPGITGVMDGLTELTTGDYDLGESKIAAGVDNVIGAITSNLPKFMEAGFAIISAIGDALTENFPKLVDTFLGLIDSLLDRLGENGGEIVGKIGEMLVKTVQTIGTKLPEIVKSLGPALINIVSTLLQDVLPALNSSLFEMLPDILQSVLDLIIQLVEFILNDGLPMILEMLPDLITGIIDFIISSSTQFTQALISIIMAIVNALPTVIVALVKAIPQIITGIITAILTNIPQFIMAGIQLFISLITALPEIIIEIVKAIPEIITGLVNGFQEAWPQIKEAGLELLVSLMTGLTDVGTKIKDAATKVWEAIKNAFSGFVEKIREIGINIIQGLIDGIKSMIGKVGDVVKGIGETIAGGFKKLFGIASPSKLFEEYGKFLDEGLAIGISTNMKPIDDAMNSMYNEVEGFSPTITPQIAPAGGGAAALQFEGSNRLISQLIIPVTFGTERLQTMIIDATNLAQYEAGGR